MLGLSITLTFLATAALTTPWALIGAGIYLIGSLTLTVASNDQGPFKVQVWSK